MGVDFDGTLAMSGAKVFDGPMGAPIPKMVNRVKAWLEAGIEVRIFTARVSPKNKDGSITSAEQLDAVRKRIADWTEEHIGKRLEATCEKDHNILQLWDDRAVQVIRDTGEVVWMSTKEVKP
jgi:hypothetical protein